MSKVFDIDVSIVPYRTAGSVCYGHSRHIKKPCKMKILCDILRRLRLMDQSLNEESPGQWSIIVLGCGIYKEDDGEPER